MSRLKIPEPRWITTDEQLAQACLSWSSEAYLAVDTEFVRTKTFYSGSNGCAQRIHGLWLW